MGKVESALAAAFYPGDYPFQYGGIAKVAGAVCYFLTKAHAFFDGNKRTAGIAAANRLSKEELIKWFEKHKVNRHNK